jgi:uncharacterized protein YdeI (YjbR/CyaY-like superfamily)
MQQSLMMPSGNEIYSIGMGKHSHIRNMEPQPVRLSSDYERHFKENQKAWMFFESQSPSYRKNIVRWIMDAKKESTRHRRLEKTIMESEAERKIV